jgi:Ni,Fe-hydrogenase III large subunit
MTLIEIIQQGRVVACAPWPRHVLSTAQWSALVDALADEPAELVALWADTVQVHALFGGPLLVSTAVAEGGYIALSPLRPAAAAFERMILDLWGHVAIGGVDGRPWLDHGVWEMARPMSLRPAASAGAAEPVLRPGPEGLHQLPLGPVRPGLGEPVHWRLHAAGEAVRQAEARLGYAHKGSLVLMRGKSPRIAARFAARLAGDATVAHSVAFARAAEAAMAIDAPPRGHALRGVMAELERAAVHLDALAGLSQAAGFALGASLFGQQREMLLRAAEAAFGHRLMMDCVVPGGVATDITPEGVAAILAALTGLAGMGALYRGPMAERLAGLGRADVAGLAPGGVAGRAAGRPGDARVAPGYPPYDGLRFTVPTALAGDAAARAQMRVLEMGESVGLLQALLTALPPGPVSVALPSSGGEGLGVAESPRGDVWYWLRLDGGMIAAAFAADPGWRLFPLAEFALADGGVGDVDLILHSFAASASGVDL